MTDFNALATKIAAARHREHKLIASEASHADIATAHAETCALLHDLLTSAAEPLGLTSAIVSAASEPKHK